MEKDKLQQILDSHKEWLKTRHTSNVRGKRADLYSADLRDANLNGDDLSYADLRGADLRDANLHGADLRDADLRDADLNGADLDFSCLPLWCGSLSAHFDDRQLKQIAYHLIKAGLQSKNASEDTKKELSKLIDFANGSHIAQKCGLIKPEVEEIK